MKSSERRGGLSFRSSGIFLLAACAAALGIGCAQPSDSNKNQDTVPKGVLAAYGISTNVGNPVDPRTGAVAAADYNPFGRDYVKLQAERKFFFTGMRKTDANAIALLDDDETHTVLATGADAVPAFDKKPHASVAADVDGDGRDEVVTAYYAGAMNNGKNTGKAYLHVVGKDDTVVAEQKIASGVDFTVGVAGAHLQQMSVAIAAGDIDDDGKSELGVVIGNTFVVLDDKGTGYSTLVSPADLRGSADRYADSWATTYWITEIAAGDIDSDGKDDFVLINGVWPESYPGAGGAASSPDATYYVYGNSATPKATGKIRDKDDKFVLYGNVAIGDLDGDGFNEVAFSGCYNRSGGSPWHRAIVAEWADGDLSLPGGGKTLDISLNGNYYRPTATLCFKPVPQPKAFLLTANQVIEYDTDTSKLVSRCTLPAGVLSTEFVQVFAAGDVDGDLAEELVCSDIGTKRVYVYNYNNASKSHTDSEIACSGSYAYGVGTNQVYSSLCLPDWDGTAVYAKFLRRELSFTEPDVIAVLASPPYWADLESASLGNCATTFETSKAESYGNSHSFNATITGKVGAGASAFDIVSVEETYGGALAYTGVTGYTVETTQSKSYSTIPGEDLVLCSTTPVDLYYYEVLRSSNAAEIGKEMLLSQARKPQTLPIELKEYNKIAKHPIDASFIGHTIGNPKTYLTKAELLAAAPAGRRLVQTDGPQVGPAGGYSTSAVSLDVTNTSSNSAAVTISHSIKAAVLISVESEQSFTYEYTHETSTADGTTITGSAPYNPVGTASDKNFTFGIASYPKVLSSTGDEILYVTYWVDPN
jgi:hypothetical protein